MLQPASVPRRSALGFTALTAAVIGGLAFATLSQGGTNARQVRPFLDEADRIAELAGLGVRQVFLTGQRMTADADIFDALDLAHARSLLRFDNVAARARIERLPWVASVAITRIFPDSISIEIAERRPFAVWLRSGRGSLIDATGRTLAPVNPDAVPELPRVSGEGAAAGAASILAVVERYPQLARRLEEAARVGERRWTLRLAGGGQILLPAGLEREALDELMGGPAGARLTETPQTVVDLRASGRMIVRTSPAITERMRPSGYAPPQG